MSDPKPGARLLRAAIGLSGPTDPCEDDWDLWVRVASDGRVFPLLQEVVCSGGAGLSAPQRDRSSDYQRDAMAIAIQIEHELLEVATVLDQCSVDFAVVKGAATAHLDYQRPSLRQFGDADLIVAPEEFSTTVAALRRRGWRQSYPLPRHHEQFTHAVTLRRGSGFEIDLHQKVAHRAIGELIPTRDLLRTRVDFEIAGHRVSAFSAIDRLIHAAIHVVGSRGSYRRLSSLADVLVIAERLTLSSSEVVSRAATWRVQRLVEAGIRASYGAALLPVPDGWLHAFDITHSRGSWLVERAYISDNRRPLIEEVAYLRQLHGGLDRMKYVLGYFTTDDEYAARNRRTGLWAQSRYLWSRVRSG